MKKIKEFFEIKKIKKICRQIKKKINKLCKVYGVKADLDTEFCCLPNKKKVYYTFLCCEEADRKFAEFFRERGCKIDTDVFVYSLLHEIGHIATYDLLSKEDYLYSQDCKRASPSLDEYFRLPDEKLATDWAVKCLNDNFFILRKWWLDVSSDIEKLYELVG